MNERPILFSGPMVRAILEGRKTQTRRVIKSYQLDNCPGWYFAKVRGGQVAGWREDKPIEPYMGIVNLNPYGDRLWVRETWRDNQGQVEYRADIQNDGPVDGSADAESRHWRPSIFMPRAYSRITLEVASVRVERLQEITHRDALAEGVLDMELGAGDLIDGSYAVTNLAFLWDQINGTRHPWSSNPWVWVVSFALAAATEGWNT